MLCPITVIDPDVMGRIDIESVRRENRGRVVRRIVVTVPRRDCDRPAGAPKPTDSSPYQSEDSSASGTASLTVTLETRVPSTSSTVTS